MVLGMDVVLQYSAKSQILFELAQHFASHGSILFKCVNISWVVKFNKFSILSPSKSSAMVN